MHIPPKPKQNMTIEKVCSSRLTHFLLVWLLLLMPLTVWAQTGWFITSNRFSSGLINDICQDGEGFIWVASSTVIALQHICISVATLPR